MQLSHICCRLFLNPVLRSMKSRLSKLVHTRILDRGIMSYSFLLTGLLILRVYTMLSEQGDQQRVLMDTQGTYSGNRPIRISTATPKNSSPLYRALRQPERDWQETYGITSISKSFQQQAHCVLVVSQQHHQQVSWPL